MLASPACNGRQRDCLAPRSGVAHASARPGARLSSYVVYLRSLEPRAGIELATSSLPII